MRLPLFHRSSAVAFPPSLALGSVDCYRPAMAFQYAKSTPSFIFSFAGLGRSIAWSALATLTACGSMADFESEGMYEPDPVDADGNSTTDSSGPAVSTD